MKNGLTFSLLAGAMLLIGPALAQQPGASPTSTAAEKFPTPPPTVTAENSIIGPDYTAAPETVANPDVPQGDIREFILYSADSKIYPGIVRTENELTLKRDPWGNRLPWPADKISAPGPYQRHVYVYIPRQVKPNAPFMVVQDGRGYIRRMAPVLDNMIAAHRLPAMIIIAPDSGGSDAQGSQRGLEYDTLSDRYLNFVEQELLPAVEKNYGVTLTKDPEGRATMGNSSGGSAARCGPHLKHLGRRPLRRAGLDLLYQAQAGRYRHKHGALGHGQCLRARLPERADRRADARASERGLPPPLPAVRLLHRRPGAHWGDRVVAVEADGTDPREPRSALCRFQGDARRGLS